MNLLFYTYSYTSYNPKSGKKNKIKRYLVVFLGDWSAKGQELQLCENCKFHLMSLKLIMKRQNESSHCNLSLLLQGFIKTDWFIIISQNRCMMKTLIMTGCAKDRIEDIKTQSNRPEGRKTSMYWYYLDYSGMFALIAGAKSFITV